MFRPLSLLFCLCALGLATARVTAGEPENLIEAPTAPTVERPALQSRSAAMAEDLARQLPASEIIHLNDGGEDFIALWRPANVAEPKGLVLLLPGNGESADWPRGIGPLRRGLPDHGWHTLSISLPDLPGFESTTAPEAKPLTEDHDPIGESPEDHAEPNEAGYLPEEAAALPDEALHEAAPVEDETTTENGARPQLRSVPEQIDARIEAALAYARARQPEKIVLLGQGTGAYWAARHLQQMAPEDVRHLLLIQPRQPEGQDEPLVQLVLPLKLATGDFHYLAGNAAAEARERLNASRRIRHPAYHQVGLHPQLDDRVSEQRQLLRRLRGWLDKQP